MELQTYSRNYGYSKWAHPNYYPHIHHLQKKGKKKSHFFCWGWKVSSSSLLKFHHQQLSQQIQAQKFKKSATFDKTNPGIKIQKRISPKTANQNIKTKKKTIFASNNTNPSHSNQNPPRKWRKNWKNVKWASPEEIKKHEEKANLF